MSAVRGTFADFKTVKTRGQCQAIIEFPIEDADHVLAVLGGIPQPSKEQWVGVAPISGVAESEDDAPDEPVKGGERARRAGILCNDPAFQGWIYASYINARQQLSTIPIQTEWPLDVNRDEYVAEILRQECNVESRAELDHNLSAGRIFDGIVDAYYDSQRGQSLEQLEEAANR